jgi:hypothetical protein
LPYTTQTWIPGTGGGTPLGATRMNHMEAGLGEHETRIAALEVDTGWLTIPIRGTFAALTGEPPQVRRRGKLVKLRGGFGTTGITAVNTSYTVADLPGGIDTPPISVNGAIGANVGAAIAVFIVGIDRSLILRTSGTVATSYYKLDNINWWID